MTPPEPVTALRDHYAVLGVDADAGEAEIRAAFRELAKRHHPDVNPGRPRAERRFAEISEARSVLLSPSRRAAFDRARDHFLRTGVAVPAPPPAPTVVAWATPRSAPLGRALLIAGVVTAVLGLLVLPLATVQDRLEAAPVHAFDPGVLGGGAWCCAVLAVAVLSWPGLRGALRPGRWEALVAVLVLLLGAALAGQVDPHVLAGGLFSSDLAGASGGTVLLLGVVAMLGGALLLRPREEC